jgi:hypothetical protein
MPRRWFLLLLPLAPFVAPAAAGSPGSRAVAEAESAYAAAGDAHGVLGAIDSGLFTSYRGRDRAAWAAEFDSQRQRLAALVAALPVSGLTGEDARVARLLGEKLASFDEPAAPGLEPGHCGDARRLDPGYVALSHALVACFTQIANNLPFEEGTIDRASALSQLHQIVEPERRKALFYAFQPLWDAVTGEAAHRPWQRLIALAAARGGDSPVDEAARTVGVHRADLEPWLEDILEAWRAANNDGMIEPWDYRYSIGEADRLLADRFAGRSLLEIDHRYYRDLGVNLDALGVLYDIAPRPGKSSVAYTDFLVRGRTQDGRWQPTVARVLASYRHATLSALNELVHEDGHAVQISAIRNRPVYVDWNDTLFVEAFADVSSWSLYEAGWQQRYLGAAAPGRASLRALYGNVMLDVAWSLFEIRMLRDPSTDPNMLWTAITSHYLRIVPHPEIPWWLMRVQLVDAPGYMVNYGLGAVVTADLRARIRERIGGFDTGNPRWHALVSGELLRFGAGRDTPSLLREFLGRPVSPDALLAQLRRLAR